MQDVEIHDTGCIYSCVCVSFTGTYVKTLSRGCGWGLFLPAGSTGLNRIIG